ncbi:MmcQ/YjbR family DNA-binding protein [Brachybacterium alimentarium]|uniref:Phosphoribosylglycinamide formyltransferase n=1 Tax=Brachybacterium alimentarium TaxID=47845 RepID=A0A2A3YM96_9MICO|nr:MmcQ/YjbR family DNA-binding protein [Brachybacterium alimentarium]PCC40401.1 phosphoribosylglycinamide formyltransferase [Brachybacterium alimentarium]RCS67773.1 MmcQ/YjbR family DNA-binding protein [Brachybacterium alimentarium]RCS68155.1 MmcQ/YjbR family DNA-binding protein [Brachybacterium alimentarium]RCS79585.1 MmcQ/YjbR family DNA-binding protein [Brachybacterium alimentarium]RCS81050.1 MmcQ/YjbR family DNA-binding protein [Brachybacterium alimentarium]
MVHPQMFDDDDPLLALVRSIALAVPGSHEKISHGRPAFHTVKVHCYYGGARKVEGEWEQHPQSVLLHLPASESAAVQEYSASFVPAYLGGSGWIGLDLDERTDPAELAELIEESYRTVAPRRLVAELDSDARPSA